jgi:hypothetical protein
LQLPSEQPSGIYFERDTLRTRTALVFSLRAWNDESTERPVTLWWRIEDAAGKTWWKQKSTVPVGARNFVLRREAWEAPQLGAYVLRIDAQATGSRKESVQLDWPFAVVSAPRPSYRPRSFFALSSPTFLGENQLDFYARAGVRILRSPWTISSTASSPLTEVADKGSMSSAPGSYGTLDVQMQARLQRKIATWGVLPVAAPDAGDASESFTASPSSASWARELSSLVPRYDTMARWEVFRAPSALPMMPASDGALRRLSLKAPLLLPLSTQNNAAMASASDGLVVSLPLDDRNSVEGRPANSATTLRALLWAQRRAARRPFHIVQNEDISEHPKEDRALDAAGFMVQRFVLGVVSGASGMSFPGFAPATSDNIAVAGVRSTARVDADEERLTSYARAAAFASMTRLLEDASRESELFTASPVLWGATFRNTALPGATPTSAPVSAQVAVLWTDSKQRGVRLQVRLPSARVLNVFGNEIARSRRGVLHVPLSTQPVYVISGSPDNVNANAWRAVVVEGLEPLAAQLLPLTKVPLTAAGTTPRAVKPGTKPATKKAAQAAPVSIGQALGVRLQNVSIKPIAGTLRLQPPSGWELVREAQSFRLQAGESRIYRFPVARSQRNDKGSYFLSATADVPGDRLRWKQKVNVATAQNVKRGTTIEVDGHLGEWRDASWMEMQARDNSPSTRNAPRPVNVRLALRWDNSRLFIAARVREPSLQPRRSEGISYPFWDDYDGLQIAFGLRDDALAKPGREPFRDTDYGFLLSPFSDANDDVEGRILRLWSTTVPFGEVRDTLRWGGAVPGAQCAIVRDEANQITTYEASLPLSEMPTMRPASRSARDMAVRFSWILHNDEGRALQWSRATNVFPWWQNTGSFLPAQGVFLAAQVPLGFTQIGAVDEGELLPATLPSAPLPMPRTPASSATPRVPTVRPPGLEPMSPRVLPPFNVPSENVLPPAPVRNEPLPQLPPSPPE